MCLCRPEGTAVSSLEKEAGVQIPVSDATNKSSPVCILGLAQNAADRLGTSVARLRPDVPILDWAHLTIETVWEA